VAYYLRALVNRVPHSYEYIVYTAFYKARFAGVFIYYGGVIGNYQVLGQYAPPLTGLAQTFLTKI